VTTLFWPVAGVVTRDFYYRASFYYLGQHLAVDIAAASGTPIGAAAAGQIGAKGYGDQDGNYVFVDHAGGWRTCHRHLNAASPLNVGDPVSQGQIIGYVGSTGNSTGPHLHLDVWNKQKLSPEAVYKERVAYWAHDPQLYLGKDTIEEDDMALTERQAFVLDYLGEEVGTVRRTPTGEVVRLPRVVYLYTLLEYIDSPAIIGFLRDKLPEMLLEPDSGNTLHTRLSGFDIQTRGNFTEVMQEIADLKERLDALQAGSGLTAEETKEVVKEAAREGTG